MSMCAVGWLEMETWLSG